MIVGYNPTLYASTDREDFNGVEFITPVVVFVKHPEVNIVYEELDDVQQKTEKILSSPGRSSSGFTNAMPDNKSRGRYSCCKHCNRKFKYYRASLEYTRELRKNIVGRRHPHRLSVIRRN